MAQRPSTRRSRSGQPPSSATALRRRKQRPPAPPGRGGAARAREGAQLRLGTAGLVCLCKLRAYFATESGSAMLEIGIGLRQTRESRGLVLAEAEAETRIRGRYLAALEEELFEALPEGYARTFLRSYANYLGLDGQLFV